MNEKNLGKTNNETRKVTPQGRTYSRPSWVPAKTSGEDELCPDCFKVVGERSRYKLVCMLGRESGGMTVGKLTEYLKLKQPTVTHHLQVLRSVDAVESKQVGRERIYRLNRAAHCFEECKIPF